MEAMQCAKYYQYVGRSLTSRSLHYWDVLAGFKIKRLAYEDIKKNTDEPKTPLVNEKDGQRKVINWLPIFVDFISQIYGTLGPLSHALRAESEVAPELPDPARPNIISDPIQRFGSSGSMISELEARLSHNGEIFQNDDKRTFIKI